MSLQLNLISNQFFSFQQKLPDDYTGTIAPGSKVLSASGPYGNIIIQEICTTQYALRYNILRFFESFKLSGRSDHAGLQTSIAWKNNFHHRIKGAGNIHLKEDQFMMLYGPTFEGCSTYSKGEEYQSFDTCYSNEMVEELKSAFPQLQKLIAQSNIHKPTLFFRPFRNITNPIREIIKTILNCPYEANLSRTYIDAKIKEFFFLTLFESVNRKDILIKATHAEVDCINAAKDLISQNIYNHYTNIQIAKMVGMNEYKLKLLFRKSTGMGMFEYLMHLRLMKAKRLLIETDMTMKEIYSVAGYKRLTSFITGFRRHLGETPGNVRRTRSGR